MWNGCKCCRVDRCREGKGCHVVLPAKARCYSGSQIQSHHAETAGAPLCDCLVLWSRGRRKHVAVVELKSGTVQAGHAVEQLQNGARLAESICDGSEVFDVLLTCVGRLRAVEINVLRRKRVRFFGREYLVRIERCGVRI